MILSSFLSGPLGGSPIAYTRSLPQLMLEVKRLGAWENSDDITPDVLLQAINFAIISAYDIMVMKWADYYTLDTTFGVDSSTATYPIGANLQADDFYKLRHMDFSTDGVRYRRMYPFDLEAQHAYSTSASSSGRVPRYRMQGPNFVLSQPTTGTIKVYYIPLPPQFTSTEDTQTITFDAPVEDKLIVAMAYRDLLVRSDLATGSADAMIANLTSGLRSAADGRDAGEPFYLNPNGPPRERYWGFGGDGEDWR